MNVPSSSNSSRPRLAVLAVLLAALFLVAGGNSSTSSKMNAETPAPEPADEDALHRTLALGTWQDEYKGKRTMHLLADGTGTMIVELSGLTAKLFASRLEFDMVWSIENGRMKKQTLGGRPEGKVKAILTMMGDRVDEPILELSDDRLLLLDADGKTRGYRGFANSSRNRARLFSSRPTTVRGSHPPHFEDAPTRECTACLMPRS
jgi:hypothetical protein